MKIAYMGWVHKKNLGDDALEQGFLKLCKENITVPYEVVCKQEHDKKDKLDLFVCGGGNLLSAWNSGWDWYLNYFITKGVPSVIFGTGVNEYRNYSESTFQTDKVKQKLLVDNIKYSKSIFVRDKHSKDIITSLNSSLQDQINVMCDLAFALDATDNDDLMKKYNIPFDKPTILLNPSWLDNLNMKENNELGDKYVELINHLTHDGFNVIILPMFVFDIGFAQFLAENVNNKEKVININEYYSVEQALGLISKCSFVIGIKLHSLILSTVVHVPFIGINYKHKCRDFTNSIQYNGMLNIDFKVNTMYKMFQMMYLQHDELTNYLTTVHQDNQKLLKESFCQIIKEI